MGLHGPAMCVPGDLNRMHTEQLFMDDEISNVFFFFLFC